MPAPSLEQASYELLLRGSRARGGHGHRRCRTQIRDQERAMASRFPGGRLRAGRRPFAGGGWARRRGEAAHEVSGRRPRARGAVDQAARNGIEERGRPQAPRPLCRSPRREPGAAADARRASGRARRFTVCDQGRRDGPRRAQLGDVLPGPSRKLLGWALLSEELTATIIVAALVILVSVAFILRRAHPRAPRQATLTTTLSFSSRRPPAEAAPCSCSNARRC